MIKLTKEIETDFGLKMPDTVWRYVSLQIDVINKQIVLVLTGHPTKEIADNMEVQGKQKQPVAQRRVTINGSDFTTLAAQLGDVINKAVYDYVRNNPTFEEFQGATDV